MCMEMGLSILTWFLNLMKHLYLSGTWFDVALRMDVTKACLIEGLISCRQYDKRFRPNNQENWEGSI